MIKIKSKVCYADSVSKGVASWVRSKCEIIFADQTISTDELRGYLKDHLSIVLSKDLHCTLTSDHMTFKGVFYGMVDEARKDELKDLSSVKEAIIDSVINFYEGTDIERDLEDPGCADAPKDDAGDWAEAWEELRKAIKERELDMKGDEENENTDEDFDANGSVEDDSVQIEDYKNMLKSVVKELEGSLKKAFFVGPKGDKGDKGEKGDPGTLAELDLPTVEQSLRKKLDEQKFADSIGAYKICSFSDAMRYANMGYTVTPCIPNARSYKVYSDDNDNITYFYSPDVPVEKDSEVTPCKLSWKELNCEYWVVGKD